ncbi:GNAT family N-acetyltransferase [Candidatus Acidianus copahuensis]|uniref:Alanine acetyltransferase n=1 Tax=Candidatus Acidianus copahuensis TaxID=1160895 RepID=A0A031LK23_9CREN|nr:N-acetyltransferase [Candidatus Acidianus copahuensis]EZQ03153.1 alanine acetyltransferase [Candidatus Acidianus copahuensis]NON62219.1 GNAT family N-acetyltransferase [Acidianus sp. RZ1]
MVIITNATEQDLTQIYEIENESFEQPYPYSLLKAYLYLSGDLYLVAKENDYVLGYIIGIVQFKIRGHLVSIATRENSRRNGIGSILLSELERRFKIAYNCFYSVLEVMTTNKEAISFYSNRSYYIVNTKKNYYGRGKHAYLMLKDLLERRGLE